MGRPVPDLDCRALDPVHMVGVMRGVADAVHGPPTPVESVAVERLERRLLRYRVDFGGGRAPWSVIGKIYGSQAEGQRGVGGLEQLWAGGFAERPPAHVRIPQPYGYLADMRLLLMEEVPGRPLKQLVKQKRARECEMRLFAAALAKLHECALVKGTPFGVDDHLAVRCAALHGALAEAFPEIGGHIGGIVERAKEAEVRGAVSMTTVHGDFHLGQVHVRGGDVWILDLDPLHLGDPAYDVAMVFVMLKHLEKRMDDAAYVRSLRDAFIDAYFSRQGYDVAERVPLHVALIHLKRACKRFRYQDEPGWPVTVRRQVREGAACMDRMATTAVRSAADVRDLYDRCPVTV